MNAICNITTEANSIKLDFSPMSSLPFTPSFAGETIFSRYDISKNEVYAKNQFACFKLKDFQDTEETYPICVVFPSSSVFKPSQMIGIAESDKPTIVNDNKIVVCRNFNGVALTSSEDLYNQLVAWFNS